MYISLDRLGQIFTSLKRIDWGSVGAGSTGELEFATRAFTVVTRSVVPLTCSVPERQSGSIRSLCPQRVR